MSSRRIIVTTAFRCDGIRNPRFTIDDVYARAGQLAEFCRSTTFQVVVDRFRCDGIRNPCFTIDDVYVRTGQLADFCRSTAFQVVADRRLYPLVHPHAVAG